MRSREQFPVQHLLGRLQATELETITRKRGFSAAPGAIAGMVSEIGYLGDRRLWTRENAADASIDLPRIRAIVSIWSGKSDSTP
jgi:hypothetical protein